MFSLLLVTAIFHELLISCVRTMFDFANKNGELNFHAMDSVNS